MIVRDVQGAMLDSREVELTVEEFDDAELGRLAKVRLLDGTLRLVRASDLAAAADDETSDTTYFQRWPSPPTHG